MSNKIADVLKYVDEQTLVVFDLDNTLIKPVYEFTRREMFFTKIKKLQDKGLSEAEARDRVKRIVDLFAFKVVPTEIVEPVTRKVFEQLRNRNIDKMVLTAREFGKAEGTVKQINSVSMFFDDKQIYSDKIDFGDQVGFAHGMLFSGGKSKGKYLFLFLDKIGYHPKKVVFVDDAMECVQSVHDKLIERSIPGVCIHYEGVAEDKSKFDFSRADDELRREFIRRGYDMSIYEDAS